MTLNHKHFVYEVEAIIHIDMQPYTMEISNCDDDELYITFPEFPDREDEVTIRVSRERMKRLFYLI